MDPYLAHLRRDQAGNPTAVQTVEQHCRKAAQYAAQVLAPVSLSAAAYCAGLLHDAGKCTRRFQDYLIHQVGVRGQINHTFAATRILLERYYKGDAADFSDVVAELLALATGGHHGLFDCVNDKGESGFQHRLTKEGIDYEEAVQGYLLSCADQTELDARFQAACEELTPVLNRILSMTDKGNHYVDDETAFYAGLLARLLLSAVIEGDRRDTAEFMNRASFPPACNRAELTQIWKTCLEQLEAKLNDLPRSSPISRARHVISDQCKQAAERSGGVFRLNVPTGSGKTLSSLRYALSHAQQYSKQRIIFTSPLLSILEQNAREIRKYIQDDSLILEHHSNLVRVEEDQQEWDERELLMETWDAPIIITTLVQLLNVLFSGKTSAIRRFHALCDSIIVIDEVQTVPSKMLTLFSLAVNFLTEICGATILLCSATQPCIEQLAHPLHEPIPDLVPYSPDLWNVFRRTEIQDTGVLSLEGIAQFALNRMETVDSLLIVCNKKSQAQRLYELLNNDSFTLFQLSAAMCVAHRRNTLDKLQTALAQKDKKVICVSTQVIEAGVDISFACAIRLSAGMDSVIQTAGRCNRNGEAGSGILAPVYLVQCQSESLGMLPDIQRGQGATGELLGEFKVCPEQFQSRLDSDEAIGYYYRALYSANWTPSGHHDYVCSKDIPSLFSLLSRNLSYDSPCPYYFRQAFRLAGSLFQVFEEDTTDVIVPYGDGATLIQDLCSGKARQDPACLKALLEKAKPYTVSLYQYQLDCLQKEHALIPLPGGALGLDGHYEEATGFSISQTKFEFQEV